LNHVELSRDNEILTDELKELLAGATRSVLEDVDERSPFGASARDRGDVTAEERWIHLRGSAHSASLLRKVVEMAEELQNSSEFENSDLLPSSSSSTNEKPLNLKNLMDSARIASQYLQQVQLKPMAKGRTTSAKSQISTKSTTTEISPFSWSDFLVHPPSLLEDPHNHNNIGINSVNQKPNGSETNSDSNTTRNTPNGGSPMEKRSTTTSSSYDMCDSTLHRKLEREDMKMFGLVPLEDERSFKQCPYCSRTLLIHALVGHMNKCRDSKRIGANNGISQKSSSTNSSDALAPTIKPNNAPFTSSSQQPVVSAAEAKQTQKIVPPPTTPYSTPVPHQVNQTQQHVSSPAYSASPPGFGPHPTAAAVQRYSFNSPVHSPPPSTIIQNPTSNNVVSTQNSNKKSASSGRNGKSTNQSIASPPPSSLPHTPTHVASPPGVVSLTGSGGIVMMTSPRAGLKSSIGFSSLSSSLSHSSTPNHPNQPLQSHNHTYSPTVTPQTIPLNVSTPGPLPRSSRSTQGGLKRSHPEMQQNDLRTSQDFGEGETIENQSGKRISYGIPPTESTSPKNTSINSTGNAQQKQHGNAGPSRPSPVPRTSFSPQSPSFPNHHTPSTSINKGSSSHQQERPVQRQRFMQNAGAAINPSIQTSVHHPTTPITQGSDSIHYYQHVIPTYVDPAAQYAVKSPTLKSPPSTSTSPMPRRPKQ
jgi:hypothetical protein